MPLRDQSTRVITSHLPDCDMDTGAIAQLRTVDIGRLHKGNEEEAANLFRAAKEDGVFYLDLQDQSFLDIIDRVDDVFAVSKDLFSLRQSEKNEYDIDRLGSLKMNGYKPVGRNLGGLHGKRDGFESYTVRFHSLHTFRHLDPITPYHGSPTHSPKIPGKAHLDLSFARPSLLTDRLPSVTALCAQIHQILALLLSSLSSSLGLPSGSSLTDLHRANVPSTDILRLLHYIAQPESETGIPQVSHTDLGSLTLLFTESPGLQVLRSHGQEWVSVLPRRGCAVVNIGDGLTMLTGGRLQSCLHRVSPRPGRAMDERYSVAYLQRTEDDVKMEALPGCVQGHEAAARNEVYTSREWLAKKFGVLRRNTWTEDMEAQMILTGSASIPPEKG